MGNKASIVDREAFERWRVDIDSLASQRRDIIEKYKDTPGVVQDRLEYEKFALARETGGDPQSCTSALCKDLIANDDARGARHMRFSIEAAGVQLTDYDTTKSWSQNLKDNPLVAQQYKVSLQKVGNMVDSNVKLPAESDATDAPEGAMYRSANFFKANWITIGKVVLGTIATGAVVAESVSVFDKAVEKFQIANTSCSYSEPKSATSNKLNCKLNTMDEASQLVTECQCAVDRDNSPCSDTKPCTILTQDGPCNIDGSKYPCSAGFDWHAQKCDFNCGMAAFWGAAAKGQDTLGGILAWVVSHLSAIIIVVVVVVCVLVGLSVFRTLQWK
jgi:hypothetical protein